MSSIGEFYDLEAGKIAADGRKISLFTKHPGTLGTFREARLKQYLSEHVGGALTVSSGFITRNDPASDEIYEMSSPQIDGIIYDGGNAAPLIKTIDFAIVDPASVAAVIEVKSDLTLFKQRNVSSENTSTCTDDRGEFVWSGTLVAALENVVQSIGVLRASGVPRGNYFAGIISYGGSSIGQFTQAMKCGELLCQLGITDLDDLPNDICLFGGKWFGLSAYKWTDALDEDFEEGADARWSFLLESDAQAAGGALQLFTAELDYTIRVARGGQPHKVGGLRSGKGFRGSVASHQIPIGSPRQHGV